MDDLEDAEDMITDLMNDHGLFDWSFKWDRAVRRFGCCKFATQTITVSRALTLLNTEKAVRETALHEIAHALVGPKHGHDAVWMRQYRAIGGTGGRTHRDTTPPKNYVGACPNCDHTTNRYRRGNLACSRCCNRYNNGRWSAEYKLVWTTLDTKVRTA
jgi:predicted SprT family Zn-dependent metalloprotease